MTLAAKSHVIVALPGFCAKAVNVVAIVVTLLPLLICLQALATGIGIDVIGLLSCISANTLFAYVLDSAKHALSAVSSK